MPLSRKQLKELKEKMVKKDQNALRNIKNRISDHLKRP